MTTHEWGYERADCTGTYALSLFLDDLERLVDHYAGQSEPQLEARLFQAQAAANKLLQAYDKNARKTDAFANQYIDIKSVRNEDGHVSFVPIFSPGLKQALVKLLNHSNQATRH
ncbi:hypothetical protein G5B35_10250 [Parapusillimonas sp. SGNA-6]|nr:hypothetical protein [Parapusillimonas sp. SGNA-6]